MYGCAGSDLARELNWIVKIIYKTNEKYGILLFSDCCQEPDTSEVYERKNIQDVSTPNVPMASLQADGFQLSPNASLTVTKL